MSKVDVDFDHRTDAGGGDPDATSPTLKKHHQVLWAKQLPSGQTLTLDQERGAYLVHRSTLGNLFLSSDTISNSFARRRSMQSLIEHIPRGAIEEFRSHNAKVSATTLFPGRKEGGLTINQARGFSRRVSDRMDLTLECIRRHYLRQPNPLASTLDRYASFFYLFRDFEGYVDYFLLEDLVDKGKVKFYLPFDDFSGSAVPTSVDEYRRYMGNTIEFLVARKARIRNWAEKHLTNL